jgi:hypothetical protein
MFEGDLSGLGIRALLSAGAKFRAVEDRAAVRQLEVALAFADRCPDPRAETDTGYGEVLPGAERGRVYGGVGCPAVAEFAAAELGAVFGWSSGAAAAFIGEALALRHRLPRIWAMVLAGEAVPWRARQVARACLALSQDAAAIVDEKLVGIINTVGWSRLKAMVKAAVLEADPEGARAAAEQAARERGVFVGDSDDHGTKTIWVKAAAGDVIRFDATVDDLARALRVLGDTDSLDLRRAKAIGWIADPASADRLLEAARLLAATRSRATTDHTPDDADADDAGTAGASAQGARTGGASAEGGRTGSASAEGATGARTDRAGRDSVPHQADGAGDRDRGRSTADTDPGAAADTGPAAPYSTEPRPADTADLPDLPDLTDLPADLPDVADPAADAAGWVPAEEPGLDAEADRDTPHPSSSDHLDYLDTLDTADLLKAMAILAWRHGPRHNEPHTAPHPGAGTYPDAGAAPGADAAPGTDAGKGTGVGPGADAETGAGASAGTGTGERTGAEAGGAGAPDPFSRQALAGKLAAIRQAAHNHGLATTTTGAGAGGAGGRGGSVLYLHLTDKTLATGEGIVRVEGAGPFPISQLAELVGHGQIIIKPVIDLNEGVSVNSYEIPDRIRERVKLMDPVDQFPYGTAETTFGTDLDHIEPYDTAGPAGQTSTGNLVPESRFHHRVKTHGRWTLRRLPGRVREWTSPHGFKWRVDRTGTHRIDGTDDDAG